MWFGEIWEYHVVTALTVQSANSVSQNVGITVPHVIESALISTDENLILVVCETEFCNTVQCSRLHTNRFHWLNFGVVINPEFLIGCRGVQSTVLCLSEVGSGLIVYGRSAYKFKTPLDLYQTDFPVHATHPFSLLATCLWPLYSRSNWLHQNVG